MDDKEKQIKEYTLPDMRSGEMLSEIVRGVKARNHAAILKAAMSSAKASVEIEGFRISSEMDELVRKRLSEQISEEEFEKAIMELLEGK
ncbi:antitoxin VbhA family protein [Peribacillus deserti]|uniref:Antitoxin VbhA domain-containing protein n=1 Tax=Peribacillus deserti TaxID=673318 RepID=A0A2N5M514_9BACI|nr:antitoxin VbhA family protein [Peribacillus deserti]PLT29447.1 hypothetical protein CUU66_13170 [Peribacillus deserti]